MLAEPLRRRMSIFLHRTRCIRVTGKHADRGEFHFWVSVYFVLECSIGIRKCPVSAISYIQYKLVQITVYIYQMEFYWKYTYHIRHKLGGGEWFWDVFCCWKCWSLIWASKPCMSHCLMPQQYWECDSLRSVLIFTGVFGVQLENMERPGFRHHGCTWYFDIQGNMFCNFYKTYWFIFR